jgi:hypothetical protein
MLWDKAEIIRKEARSGVTCLLRRLPFSALDQSASLSVGHTPQCKRAAFTVKVALGH